jgi:two-component system, OmpR family, response regulator
MRVLLVEDEERMAAALRRGLLAEGFDVELASDGTDGYWRASERPYDAIVLDILLPGMNGYRVCRALRAGGVWTPILMLTAKDGELDEAEALDTGADDFLRKPFSFVVLVARLRALVRRGSAPRPALLSAGTLVFDPAARTCTLNGEPVTLTAREAALLELLLRRTGEVVPKHELLDAVWGDDGPEDVNIVEVYVGYLRRKLGTGRIRTVRGAGYRLEDGDA